jgi:hypothetical protein
MERVVKGKFFDHFLKGKHFAPFDTHAWAKQGTGKIIFRN